MSQISAEARAVVDYAVNSANSALRSGKEYFTSKEGRAFVYDAARIIAGALILNVGFTLARYSIRYLFGMGLSPLDRSVQSLRKSAIASCDDAERVLQAAQRDPSLLQKASFSLQSDIDFGRGAAAIKGATLCHLNEELLSNPEICAIALCAYPKQLLDKDSDGHYIIDDELLNNALKRDEFSLITAILEYSDPEYSGDYLQRLFSVLDHGYVATTEAEEDSSDSEGGDISDSSSIRADETLAIIHPGLAEKLLDNSYYVIPHLHPALLESHQFPFVTIARDPSLVAEMSEHWDLSVDFLLNAFEVNSSALEYIKLWEVYKSYEESLEGGNRALELISVKPKLAAEWRNAARDSSVPEFTDEIFKAAICQNADVLVDFPDVTANDEAMRTIILDVNPRALAHASERLRDDDKLVRDAAIKHPYAFKFASERIKNDRDRVNDLVGIHSEIYCYAGEEIRKLFELLTKVWHVHPSYVESYTGKFSVVDLDQWVAFIAKNSDQLRDLPVAARNHHDVVEAAVKVHPESIRYVGDELYGNIDFLVNLATHVNCQILRYIKDWALLQAILRHDSFSTEHTGEEHFRDVAEHLVKFSPELFRDLPLTCRQDEGVIRVALSKNPELVYELPPQIFVSDFLANFSVENPTFLSRLTDSEFIARYIVSRNIDLLSKVENVRVRLDVALAVVNEIAGENEEMIRGALAACPEILADLPESRELTTEFLVSLGKLNSSIVDYLSEEQKEEYLAALEQAVEEGARK